MRILKHIDNIRGNEYDYVIVGAGLAGITHANEISFHNPNARILMIEKRSHIGGNVYTEKQEGIDVHVFGSHIFHTNNDDVWNFVNSYAIFNDYKHRVIANTDFEHCLLPFTMVTFMQLFNVSTVQEVQERIADEIYEWRLSHSILPGHEPKNFEEQAIMIVGTTIYEKLIKYYTEKQWGRNAKTLPAEIIKRLPLRWNTDTTYFNNAKYQGIPVQGYTKMMQNMLDAVSNLDIIFNTSFNDVQDEVLLTISTSTIDTNNFIYTGAIDELFGYALGHLEYRSLVFEHETLDIDNYQGTAVVNFTGVSEKFTRIHEHKWYNESNKSEKTIISKEFSEEFEPGKNEPYYPIGDAKNRKLYEAYVKMFRTRFQDLGVLSGRLAEYKYYDMDKTIESVLNFWAQQVINN